MSSFIFIEMTAMINLNHKKEQSQTTINVSPITNVNVGDKLTTTPEIKSRDTEVIYPDDVQVLKSTADYDNLYRENQVLKLIIQLMNENPLRIKDHIIADDTVLIQFIKLLTNADDVQIDAEDIGSGCITKNNYCKVNAIYVIKDGDTKNLKYDYPAIIKELNDLKICTKFVF
jgi:hypothetical protein